MTELQRRFSKWTTLKRVYLVEIIGEKATKENRAFYYPIIEEMLSAQDPAFIRTQLSLFLRSGEGSARDRKYVLDMLKL